MQLVRDAYQYFLERQPAFWQATGQHLSLSLTALALSIGLGVTLGIWIARRTHIAQPVIGFFGALRLIPSLAVLFLALPYLGTGMRPALLALTILAIPPILINTYTGLRGVERAVIDAAYGMGMETRQVLRRVELPLAAPAMIAGIRIAAVEAIASATLAAFIAAGGLGQFVYTGYTLNRPEVMLVGAVPVALLALLADQLLGTIQRKLARHQEGGA
jgi:osmoprotectant transport system permease protein